MSTYIGLSLIALSQAIDLTSVPFDMNSLSSTEQSVVYVANTNYSPCECDIKTATCDAFCCCDVSCSENLRNEWNDAQSCSNTDYSVATGKTLGDCLRGSELYKFNTESALQDYIDPFTSLFCV